MQFAQDITLHNHLYLWYFIGTYTYHNKFSEFGDLVGMSTLKILIECY